MTRVKVTERYDATGELIERVVETTCEYDTVQPAYVSVLVNPWPQPWLPTPQPVIISHGPEYTAPLTTCANIVASVQ